MIWHRKAKKLWSAFWKGLAAYLAICGLITFSLFILEESFQTAMFGTWPAQDAGDWKLVKQGADTMQAINQTMKTLNYVGGWIQPFAFIAYRSYGKAGDAYVAGLRAKVFAHCPEVYLGERVEFSFVPTAYEDGFAIGGPIRVPAAGPLEEDRYRVTGTLGAKMTIESATITPERMIKQINLPRYSYTMR